LTTLRGQENLVIRLGHMGGDVERLGAVLDESWCKVEVCGSVYGGGLAAADYGVKGKHVV
ncbi:hypothetical protein Tco_0974754, partial [Tanacetum coccineum]